MSRHNFYSVEKGEVQMNMNVGGFLLDLFWIRSFFDLVYTSFTPGVGAVCQPLILRDEQSGLLTHTGTKAVSFVRV